MLQCYQSSSSYCTLLTFPLFGYFGIDVIFYIWERGTWLCNGVNSHSTVNKRPDGIIDNMVDYSLVTIITKPDNGSTTSSVQEELGTRGFPSDMINVLTYECVLPQQRTEYQASSMVISNREESLFGERVADALHHLVPYTNDCSPWNKLLSQLVTPEKVIYIYIYIFQRFLKLNLKAVLLCCCIIAKTKT